MSAFPEGRSRPTSPRPESASGHPTHRHGLLDAQNKVTFFPSVVTTEKFYNEFQSLGFSGGKNLEVTQAGGPYQSYVESVFNQEILDAWK